MGEKAQDVVVDIIFRLRHWARSRRAKRAALQAAFRWASRRYQREEPDNLEALEAALIDILKTRPHGERQC